MYKYLNKYTKTVDGRELSLLPSKEVFRANVFLRVVSFLWFPTFSVGNTITPFFSSCFISLSHHSRKVLYYIWRGSSCFCFPFPASPAFQFPFHHQITHLNRTTSLPRRPGCTPHGARHARHAAAAAAAAAALGVARRAERAPVRPGGGD